MSGAASYSAGYGPAGFDPAQDPTVLSSDIQGAVLFWDPATSDFQTLDTGLLATIHEVDQEVVLALTIPLGSIPSSPETGSRFHLLPLGKTIQADCEREASYALRRVLARNDIKIVSVKQEIVNRSALWVRVDYINLRLKDTTGTRPNASTGVKFLAGAYQ